MAACSRSSQLGLFGPEPGARASGVGPAPTDPGLAELASRLPSQLRLGTSSWSFPGWSGIVYDRAAPKRVLARDGLAAYARHPLLRAVGLDRSFYGPVTDEEYARYAAAVPADFHFLVKAPELLTLRRFPRHARYGAQRGLENSRWLDAEFAGSRAVGPVVRGLGEQLGALLFQFPPQDPRVAGEGAAFAERLHEFLRRLPRGPLYAVEIRNPEWLTPEYRDSLRDVGAVHCVTLHPRMPDAATQVERATASADRGLVVRWMLRGAQRYEQARDRYAPFDRLADPDPERRRALATLLARSVRKGRPALVIINNKAEGSAPLSAVLLARATLDALSG